MSTSRTPTAKSLFVGFVVGPSALAVASLIDILLATRIFVSQDPIVGTLAFFIFGATTGVPIQLMLARCIGSLRLWNASPGNRVNRNYNKFGAALTGILGAVSTASWLYAIGRADPAAVLPLANMTPVFFAVAEGVLGRLRFGQVFAPILLLLAGFWIVRTPGLASLGGLTSTVILVLVARNLASAGSEAAERLGARGATATFTAVRFAWLALVGVPAALIMAGLTGRLVACAELVLEGWTIALPVHSVTMLLSFIGGLCRTKAKGQFPLTLCSAIYTTPLVLAPLLAAGVNLAAEGFFPTVTGSASLLGGGLLVVASSIWLVVLRGGASRQVDKTVDKPTQA